MKKAGNSRRQQVDVRNAEVVKRDDYAKTLKAIIAGGFCPFCEEHLFRHHSRPIVYKSKHWLVTENAWPYEGSRHHFLFIARKHVENIEELSATAWTELHAMHRFLVKRCGLKGATLFIRSGDTKFTGASVNHLHAQVIVGGPRTKNPRFIKALVGFKR